MFVFCRPEDSEAQHQELLRLERKIWDALEIPYRVIDIASADLGAPAYRKFDLEAWMPGRGEGGDWGEITSTSNCTDFQARRLKVRFRRTREGAARRRQQEERARPHAERHRDRQRPGDSSRCSRTISRRTGASASRRPSSPTSARIASDRVRRSRENRECAAMPDAPAASLVLGTAGHIDHGKTALVRALTGHDTDRLPEEKARGITIELGFAALDLASGVAARRRRRAGPRALRAHDGGGRQRASIS